MFESLSSQKSSPEFRTFYHPKPQIVDCRVSGFRVRGSRNSGLNISPPNPEIVDCRVSGFGVRGSRNSGLNISNFIDLPKFPKSRAPTPTPETRQSTISGFGSW
ncbi:hypothetical protein EV424DRAFT_1344525 [Suillus variegatus]|nr:hypothetical protein EV424DRAFT_1344525 [Suillus variegatus]